MTHHETHQNITFDTHTTTPEDLEQLKGILNRAATVGNHQLTDTEHEADLQAALARANTTPPMNDLTTRLATAINKDERAAHYVLSDYANHQPEWNELSTGVLNTGDDLLPLGDGPLARFIAHNDPASVLRHCTAHRKILGLHTRTPEGDCRECGTPGDSGQSVTWPCVTLLALAEYYGIQP